MDTERIENIATRLLRDMWLQRERLSSSRVTPLQLLEPQLAARLLGVKFEVHAGLGRFGDRGEQFEVAGFIDRQARRIAVSQQFAAEIMRFTGAHELGHWLLHPREVMHRDRPIKGIEKGGTRRSLEEREADYFSACFLAPRKLVTKAFIERFHTAPLPIDDAAAFWLSPADPDAILRAESGSLERAVTIATAKSYGTRQFEPLAKLFRVSPTTMAIRLQELKLIRD
jgi:hypothetical protein